MDYHAMTDGQILSILGDRLRKARLRQDITQAQLAEFTGLGYSTVQNLEKGNGRIASFVSILRALDQLDALDFFIPDPGFSPIQLAKLQGKVRQRASGSNERFDSTSDW